MMNIDYLMVLMRTIEMLNKERIIRFARTRELKDSKMPNHEEKARKSVLSLLWKILGH